VRYANRAPARRCDRPGRASTGRALNPRKATNWRYSLRHFYELLAAEPRVCATAIETVGSKSHYGFALALVIADR
jgi:hypothetical protein